MTVPKIAKLAYCTPPLSAMTNLFQPYSLDMTMPAITNLLPRDKPHMSKLLQSCLYSCPILIMLVSPALFVATYIGT